MGECEKVFVLVKQGSLEVVTVRWLIFEEWF